jgi:hypothetical protein
MKDLFVPYEIASRLEDIGFEEPSLAYYDSSNHKLYQVSPPFTTGDPIFGSFVPKHNKKHLIPLIGAPLYQQVFDWFRKEHNLLGEVNIGDKEESYTYRIWDDGKTRKILGDGKSSIGFDFNGSFDKAKLKCVMGLISIVHKRNK